jgi:hypothetical protein
VSSEQLTDGVVKALELVTAKGDADQGRGEALGHRERLLAGADVAVPVALVDQVAVADDQQAAQLGVVGGVGVEFGQDLGVHAGLGGRGGTPAGGGPVVALGRHASRPAGTRRLLALLAGARGRYQAGHHDHQ